MEMVWFQQLFVFIPPWRIVPVCWVNEVVDSGTINLEKCKVRVISTDKWLPLYKYGHGPLACLSETWSMLLHCWNVEFQSEQCLWHCKLRQHLELNAQDSAVLQERVRLLRMSCQAPVFVQPWRVAGELRYISIRNIFNKIKIILFHLYNVNCNVLFDNKDFELNGIIS